MATRHPEQGFSALARKLFDAKEAWHRDRARLVFSEKLRVLARRRNNASSLPKLVHDHPHAGA